METVKLNSLKPKSKFKRDRDMSNKPQNERFCTHCSWNIENQKILFI